MLQRAAQLTNAIPDYKRHGFLFDSAIFLTNGLGATQMGPEVSELSDPFIGLLLVIAILTQLVGAALKKKPLGRRLALRMRHKADVLDRAMDGLLILHLILFTLVTIMALSLLGIAPAELGDAWAALGLGIGACVTYFVWKAGRGGHNEQVDETAPEGLISTEYLADGLLWISVSIVTLMLWGMFAGDVGTAAGIGLNVRAVVLLWALSVLFVAFYLPARYLFLVEDYRSPSTWLQMWLAMLPVARLVLVG